MWTRVVCLLVFFVVPQLTASWTHAEESYVFGPSDCTIGRWHVHFSHRSFKVEKPGKGVLVLNRKEAKGKINGGFLLFNKRLIPLRGLPRENSIVLSEDVHLKSRNTLTVFLRGTPGASLTVAIRGEGGATQPPQVTFSALPTTIHSGETSTLSWTSKNAESVSIDGGIGPVDFNGSLSVSPSETTAYTLMAFNSAGTTTKTETVTRLNTAPVAFDDIIDIDENTPVTLTDLLFNDADVDEDELSIAAFTQPANGSVSGLIDGTITYTPRNGFSGRDEFTYTVTDGHGGVDTAMVEIHVIPVPLAVEITSPIQEEQLSTPAITVTGTVTRVGGKVFVNGIAARMSGYGFSADEVPLTPGANTISVLVEEGAETKVASITVFLLSDIDLQPLQLEIEVNDPGDASLKLSGQATVTLANNGTSALATPCRIVLFEDTNTSGSYEASEDNRLAEELMTTPIDAGESAILTFEFAGQRLFRDNRLHVLIDSADDLQESNEDNNIIASRAGGMDISASLVRLDDSVCPDMASLSVRIGNAGDAPIPESIPVSVYEGEPGNGGLLVGTATSSHRLEPGQYEDLTLAWKSPSTGSMLVSILADDNGNGMGGLNETDEENNRVRVEATVCPLTQLPEDGISVKVVDALSGAFLPEATIRLYTADNGEPGALIDQSTTDDFGDCAFSELIPGVYFLVAGRSGYIPSKLMVALASAGHPTHWNVALSPVMDPNETRIVLTWGDHPADLEAHLTAPNPGGCRHHCFYWNQEIPGARLDLDDSDAYGPETITIQQRNPGTYRFYVHDFTNSGSLLSDALSQSGARVTVYSGSGDEPRIFDVPAGKGTVWHVFNLDGDSGSITPIQKMTFQDHPGRIDFPRFTTSPITRSIYGETYTCRVAAEDPDQDVLTFNLVDGPAGMAIDPFSGILQWTPNGGQGGRQNVDIRVNDGRCGEDDLTFQVEVAYLPVVHFSVEPTSGINPGGDIVLTWQTERADTVVIDQGIGAVSESGGMTIPSPDQPIRFTLTAANDAGNVQQSIPKPPVITHFSATCLASRGDSSTLTWTTDHAVDCQIDQGIGSVPVDGSTMVTPSELPVEYRLTCHNGAGISSDTVRVAECSPYAHLGASVDCGWEPGDPVTLNWTTHAVEDCTIQPAVGSVPLNGSMEVRPIGAFTRYTIACTGAGASVDVENPRSVDLAASSIALIPGESTTLFWNTACVDACTFDQGIGEVPLTGNLMVTPEYLPITYTLTAAHGLQMLSKSITIYLREPAATFSASPTVIKNGEPATLTWTTDRASSCTIEPDIGDVPLNGSIVVAPEENTRYLLTAAGPGGTTRRKAAVTFVKPSAAIHADPEHLDTVGQPVRLTWVFSNADSCVIDQGIGEVQLGDSVVVNPRQTTTYTITATGPGGVAVDAVTVAYPVPTVSIVSDRDVLDEGETATLTWTCSNTDSLTIDQGIGGVQPGGSVVVDPMQTSDYTITANGPGGSATDRITLTCLAPQAEIQASPATVVEGTPVTLNWNAAHAATRVIEPAIGPVETEGTLEIVPRTTTTYTLTASGRGGVSSTQATVAVINPPSITLIEPDGEADTAHTRFTIQWSDRDPDSDATIALYYDINGSGADGTLIVDGISENPDGSGDQYVWNTAGIPAGFYYVYAVIDDEDNAPAVAYSPGAVFIDHAVAEEIKLIASDGEAFDSFGSSVALSGGYAVVGAPFHADGGAAYVFEQKDAGWIETDILRPSDGAMGEEFGTSVSISGDTIVVGAPNGNGTKGIVCIFINDGQNWIQAARLTAPDGEDGDRFGTSVCMNENGIVVGAPNHGNGSGAAYFFPREAADWGEPIRLTPQDDIAEGQFGASVSISADRIIAGSPFLDNQAGAAWIFRHSGSEWVEEVRLVPGDITHWSRFGTSVSISGDYAIVGNSGLAEAGVDGAAYIFTYDGFGWIEQEKIKASDVGAGGSFGRAVYIHGDTAAVGEANAWNEAGAVYLFNRLGDRWIEHGTPVPSEEEGEGQPAQFTEPTSFRKLVPADGAIEDCFGYSVALDDGNIIVGARLDDDKANDAGSAYIYPIFSVGIDADPPSLQLDGEQSSSALRWNAWGADSVRIDPDVGIVAQHGTMTIAPRQTTTFTITGTRGTTVITDRVTVTVIDDSALPAVSISAEPETIYRGEAATLSWSAINVAGVTLDNGIGEASMEGSLIVFPQQTTTYTVTATNGAGIASASATIHVLEPLPTVTLSVDTAEIEAGQTAMLSWASTNAVTVSIEPNIGIVGLAGALPVSPMQTTTYTITAAGSGGMAVNSADVAVSNPISLQITDPYDGSFVSGTAINITGTLTHADSRETGLTVNGVLAIVSGDLFVANHVQLIQGENIITAKATDSSGVKMTDSITVQADSKEDYIYLTADPASGSPPFETTLRVHGMFDFTSSRISYVGPDNVVFLNTSLEEFQVEIMTEGIYTFTAEVTDVQGNTYSANIAVEAVDKASLDELLQSKWAGMKNALIAGNVVKALEYHATNIRDRYAMIYDALGGDLPILIERMQEIKPIYLDGTLAKYRILQDHDVEGKNITITYYVYFSKDEHGIWKIEKY